MIQSDIAERILFQDDDLIILDKPAGLAVHPAPGAGANMESWLVALTHDGIKPGLGHRLDRDTSGCLVLGRHPKALRRLGLLFANGSVRKEYWAVVEGAPPEAEGMIDKGISRFRRDKLALSQIDPKGAKAETRYRVLGEGDSRSWLSLEPLTGRTHQLRVHCAAIGCPIVADPFYGKPGNPGERLHLHARGIRLPYYRDGIVEAKAVPPRQMWPALGACGWRN